MTPSPSRTRDEGLASWLAIGAIVVAMLLFDAWVVWAGRSPGRIPDSVGGGALYTLAPGGVRTWPPGRIVEGSVLACARHRGGVSVTAPAAGRVATGRAHGLTLVLAHREDGSLEARCR